MIRAVTLLGSACLLGALVLLSVGASPVLAVLLILASIAIGVALAIRAAFHKAKDVVSAAHNFVTGRVQHARLVEVGDPKGIFFPAVPVVLELEAEDGARHRFEREMPVPLPWAWGYRLGKRFNLPLLGKANLSELLAFELKREGLNVSVSRGGATLAAEPDKSVS